VWLAEMLDIRLVPLDYSGARLAWYNAAMLDPTERPLGPTAP
jgi:hypothetical protein